MSYSSRSHTRQAPDLQPSLVTVTGNRRRRSLVLALLLAGLTMLAMLSGRGRAAAQADDSPGAVFSLTNEAAGNQVLVWTRSASGQLTPAGAFATGGQGSGDALGSQGALTISDDGRFLFAVNAGSNDVTAFALQGEQLT